jgi:hypothetical protein
MDSITADFIASAELTGTLFGMIGFFVLVGICGFVGWLFLKIWEHWKND